MFLAIREMRHSPARFVLITAVIVLVSYLVYFLTALAYGLASSYTAAISQWDAAGIVLSSDSNKNAISSHLTDAQVEQVMAGAGGDDNAASLYVIPTVVTVGEGKRATDPSDEEGEKVNAFLFGVDFSSFLAPHLADGAAPSGELELVVDDGLAAQGLGVGEQLRLPGVPHTWHISGVSTPSSFQASPVLFISQQAFTAHSRPDNPIPVEAVVVTDAGFNALRGHSQMLAENDLELVTIDEFIDNMPGYRAQVLTFSLMIGSLIGILALVLGIFVYVLTMQKKQIFGIMKAQGIPTAYIVRSGVAQTLTLTVIGVGIGLLAALATGAALGDKIPFAVNPLFFGAVSLAFLIFTTLGGLASIRSITKIDPIEAMS